MTGSEVYITVIYQIIKQSTWQSDQEQWFYCHENLGIRYQGQGQVITSHSICGM